MLKKIDNRLKGLLWFLFESEESGETHTIMADRRPAFQNLTPGERFQETLKSAVWISVSILLSLTLAHLH